MSLTVQDKSGLIQKVLNNNSKRSETLNFHDSSTSMYKSETKPDYECVLLDCLLKFVHCQGKIGDYARNGLLYLFEMAGGHFKDFIMNCTGFNSILSANLGGLYSQLPQKIKIPPNNGSYNIVNNSSNFINFVGICVKFI